MLPDEPQSRDKIDRLSELPEELQLIIYKCLDDRRDSNAMSKSCRNINRIVEPLLYSSFEESGKRDTLLLVRTLLGRPELAQHFKGFSAFCYWIQKTTKPRLDRYNTFTREAVGARLSMREWIAAHIWDLTSPLDIGDRWLKALYDCERRCNWECSHYKRNWAPWTALLLMLLPNVEKFYLPDYSFAANPPQSALTEFQAHHVRTGVEVLTKLREVILVRKEIPTLTGMRAVVDDEIMPFLRIPLITSLYCTIHAIPSALFNFSEGMSHLQHLDIQSSVPFSGLLRMAPCGLRSLKTLKISNQLDRDALRRGVWHTGSIAPHLKEMESLKELHLTPYMYTMRNEWDYVDAFMRVKAEVILPVPIGSLTGLKHLKRIESTSYMFMGQPLGRRAHVARGIGIGTRYETRGQTAPRSERECRTYDTWQIDTFLDSLPEDLEEIMIWNCKVWIMSVLPKLIAALKYQRRFGKLKKVELVFDASWKEAEACWRKICEWRGGKRGESAFTEGELEFRGRVWKELELERRAERRSSLLVGPGLSRYRLMQI